MISRAQFLARACLACLAPALDGPWTRLIAGPAASRPGAAEGWHLANAGDFAALVGSTFDMTAADGSRAGWRLARVVPGLRHPGVEQFTLLFQAGAASGEQGLFMLRHATLGATDIFATPRRHDHVAGTMWEACFARLTTGRSDGQR